jgi:glyoxylase-like metal-dependent hydrolase (beta-lactamase superfamily II)
MLEDEFCDIIKKARTGLGLDPNQVARDAGLSTPALRELEAGRLAPTPEEVHALAAALRLDGAKLAAIACDGWHPRHPIANTVQDVITIHGDIGGYAVKGYLYHDPATRQAVLIDTGYHPEAVLRAIEQHRLTLTAICLTHGHADHASGIDTILARHQAPVYIGEGDWPLLGWKPPTALRKFVREEDALQVGRKEIRLMTTPGHTPGGVCYQADQCVFVGDTLFAGSIGRANPATLYATHLGSVRERLLTLPDSLLLFPGHGPSTTVREEKDHNPFG